jgi:ribosomal protein S21
MSRWKDFDFSKFRGLQIVPKQDEDPDRIVKRFSKKVRNDGVLQDLYMRRGYEKPSVKRRRKSSRARFMKRFEDES